MGTLLKRAHYHSAGVLVLIVVLVLVVILVVLILVLAAVVLIVLILVVVLVLVVILVVLVLVLLVDHDRSPPYLYLRHHREAIFPRISGFILIFEKETYDQSGEDRSGDPSGRSF